MDDKMNQDKTTPPTPPTPTSPNLRFTVMPDLEGIGKMPKDIPPAVQTAAPLPPTPPTPPAAPKAPSPAPVITSEVRERMVENNKANKPSHRKRNIIIVLTILVLFAAGAGAAFFMDSRESSSSAEQNEDENKDDAINTPSDDATDSDKDGISDQDEKDLGIDPQDPDSDKDGLSDGDEILVFKTSPLTSKSDSDSFDDGSEVANGYDPLLATVTKLSAGSIAEYGKALRESKMHEPTVTTLLKSPIWQSYKPTAVSIPLPTETQAPAAANEFKYTDELYGYKLTLPGSWKLATGGSVINKIFNEQASANSRFVQIQAYVGLDKEGEVSTNGLLESEITRLTATAISDVKVRKATVGGVASTRIAAELKKDAKSASVAVIEYIVPGKDASFVVTTSCTSATASCMAELEAFAPSIEAGLKL